jgi:two-component system OmpR family sensor kinase
VGSGGIRLGRAGTWLLGRGPLRVRLVVAAVGLTAAGAAIIGSAGILAARGSLVRQADRQLRVYAGALVSHPFTAAPASRLAPAPDGLGGRGFGVEVLSSAGRPVMRLGRIPAVSGKAVAGGGRLDAVPAGSSGGSWIVIAEPVRYRARRILFTYGYDDVSLFIAGPDRPGQAGRLIVGLDLSGVDRVIGRLALACLAVGCVAAVAVTLLGVMGLRALLRPLATMEERMVAVSGGEFSRRVPGRDARDDAGTLSGSLNTMLGQIERRFSASAEPEAAARTSARRLRGHIIDTGHQLQWPLSVIRGFADYYRQRGPLSTGEFDHMMRRVAAEAARVDALINDLLPPSHDQPHPPQQ